LTVLSQGATHLLLPIRTAPAETDQVDGIPEAFRFREQSSFRSSVPERLRASAGSGAGLFASTWPISFNPEGIDRYDDPSCTPPLSQSGRPATSDPNRRK
jgi:hypothetical protein